MMTNTLSDKEYYALSLSIGKALNAHEVPVKSKHARAAIIGTYHSNGGHAFWAIALRQPLQENRITAWKFCFVLHKLLREGHPLVLNHSMRHRTMLQELGKLWGHLADGYGLCILQYTKLLINKLNFHDRNPKFPGNLQLKRGELEKIAANDINVYFQLAIEMFDYLDEIIGLQATIFNSITTFAVSSMTAAGQCRLIPLIPCIQDSNQLYDFVVRLMFLLHGKLEEDLLVHHRERFRTIFRQLNSFYKQSGQLQYFANLITVPVLPKNPPNFLQQSELGNYTTPRLKIIAEDSVSESESNSAVDNLVDTNAEEPPKESPPPRVEPPAPSVNYERMLRDREDIIHQLQQENENQRSIFKRTISERQVKENHAQEQISKLTSDLAELQNEIMNLRLQNEELELKAETAPNLEQKVLLEEEKLKTTEEKFQKLKTMYTQIRDEHITLLRKHGETNKALQETNKNFLELSNQNEEFKARLQEIEMEKSKISELHQRSSSEVTEKIDSYEQRIAALSQENKNLIEQFQDVESSKSAQIAELQIKLKEIEAKCESAMESVTILEEEKKTIQENYTQSSAKSDEEFREIINTLKNEKEELESKFIEKEQEYLKSGLEATEKIEDYEQRILMLDQEIKNLTDQFEEVESCKKAEIAELQTKLKDIEDKCESALESVTKLEEEKRVIEENYKESSAKSEEQFREIISTVNNEKEELENKLKEKEQEFLKSCLEATEKIEDYEQRISMLDQEYKNLTDQFQEVESSKSAEIAELQTKLKEIEDKCESAMESVTKLEEEKRVIEENYIESSAKSEEQFKEIISTVKIEKEELECRFKEKEQEFLEEIERKTNELQIKFEEDVTQLKIKNEASISALMKTIIKGFEEISSRSTQETPGTQTSSAYFIMLSHELQDLLTKMTIIYKSYSEDNNLNSEGFARNVINSGHLLSVIYDRGMAICNTLTNINSGEKIANEVKEFGIMFLELFKLMLNDSDTDAVKDKVDHLKEKLYLVTNMIGDITSNKDELDKLEDLVEKELNSMDRAVEEAAKKIEEMLTQSRASDNGIKLEVNEKILESCTNLMQCIKILVQKSRKVQNEIVASGKGSLSTKEFYKRNHQWTEGLISAGKSVAAGAKFLVDAANKAVTEQSNHTLDVIVAAQEIAANVAVLVVSSRVKASRDSQNLLELTRASKDVTECVGAVVATSKNCSQQLEENQEFDFTKLSIHQAKTKEMEVQVRVLELEQSLLMERRKLASLRRQNYQSE